MRTLIAVSSSRSGSRLSTDQSRVKNGTLTVAATLVLALAGNSMAASRISLPALDFKGDLFQVVPNGTLVTSSLWITIWGSPRGTPPFGSPPTYGAPANIYPFPNPGNNIDAPFGAVINEFKDYISYGGGGNGFDNPARYVAAAAYIRYDDASLNSDMMTITTIYGRDTDPTTPGSLALAGFDTAGSFPTFSGENIIGPSGTVYPAGPGELLPISSLSGVLGAGADLSIFSGPESNSVYVFQTQLPFGEAVIPEPTTLGVVAAVGLLATRRRRV